MCVGLFPLTLTIYQTRKYDQLVSDFAINSSDIGKVSSVTICTLAQIAAIYDHLFLNFETFLRLKNTEGANINKSIIFLSLTDRYTQ